ncbi:hypothetical protein UPYG_G00236260 [Umbra pygmaea]|uniref:Family with sequence similarity 113 n=1 Tax=Umbra pygmaea TaxID=75934 RepID=A0ABD0WFZ4_UMBPY
MRETMNAVSHQQASQLLHNQFVVVLGDSIQRSVYKDLVLLLQKDKYLSSSQLRSKGEMSFEQDTLVEGGKLGQMTNGTEYREVRQFRSDHHLVRFYFVTRIFSRYMESVLNDFKHGLKPDVVIVNSCVWDISRYNSTWHVDYRENLHKFFDLMRSVLPPQCVVIWNMTMPLGKRITGGFLVPEVEQRGPTLRHDVIEANFYSCKIADAYGMDVLDLHFKFRFSLQHRMKDGVHWNSVVHRHITSILLQHTAQAWGVALCCTAVAAEHIDHAEQQQQLKAYTSTVVENTGNWQTDWFSGYEPWAGHFTATADQGWQPANLCVQPYRLREVEYDGYKQQYYEDSSPKSTVGYFSFEDLHANRQDHHRPQTGPEHRRQPVNRLLDNRFIENEHFRQTMLNETYQSRPYVLPALQDQFVMRKKKTKRGHAPYKHPRRRDFD